MSADIGRDFVLLSSGARPTGTELVTRAVAAGDSGMRVAIDKEGFRHLLVPVPDEVPRDRQSVALSIEPRVLSVGGAPVLFADLKCLDTRLSLVFERLVTDVVARVESGVPPEVALPYALNQWRQLFQGGGSSGFTVEQVIGLIGELQVLLRLSESMGAERALDAWWGPDGHPHDFYSTADRAIEVKTTRSLEGNRIHVSNVAQMDPSNLTDLHLAVFRLRPDRLAPTLDDRITSLLELGFPAARTLTKIEAAGHVHESAVPFSTRFAVVWDRWWVVGSGFPGVRESRIDAAALRGVSNITYKLSLDAVGPAMPPEAVDELMQKWDDHG